MFRCWFGAIVLVVIVLLSHHFSAHAQPELTIPVEYSLTTILGGQTGDGIKATLVGTEKPIGLAVDKRNNNLFYADSNNHQVRFMDKNGFSRLFAGSPTYQSGAGSDSLVFANDTLNTPYGVAINSKGDVFVVDDVQNRVKRIYFNSTVNAWNMITIAGGGTFSSFAAAPALSIKLTNSRCIAVSPKDEVYICDAYNSMIRKIVNDTIIPVVGTGTSGTSADGVLATSAKIRSPTSIAFHPITGEMYFADSVSSAIRYVASNGTLLTYASIDNPRAIVFNSTNGDLYAISLTKYQIIKFVNGVKTVIANSVGTSGFSGDGGNALSATFTYPVGLAIIDNNLYISDYYRIRKIDLATNIITTVVGDGSTRYQFLSGKSTDVSLASPQSTVYNSRTDELFIVDSYQSTVVRLNSLTNYRNTIVDRIAGTGKQVQDADGRLGNETSLFNPYAVARADNGDIYIGTGSGIKKLSKTSQLITTFAGSLSYSTGDGYPAISARISPNGLALSSSGEIFLSDSGTIRKIALNGIISTVAGNGVQGYLDGSALSAQFYVPSHLCFTPSGDLLISEESHRIRKLSPTGSVTTIAGTGNTTFNGEGISALTANINFPGAICVNSSNGDIFYSDLLDTNNYRIRKIDNTGKVFTIVGNGVGNQFTADGQSGTSTTVSPRGLAIHPITKELYFIDIGIYQSVIRRIDSVDGKVYTVVGSSSATYSKSSLANSTSLGGASFISFSPNGDLYINSQQYSVIKKMDYGSNIVYDVAGIASPSFKTGDGPALSTSITTSNNLVFSAEKNELLFVDSINIRKLSSGMISTIAGGIGDGGLAVNSKLVTVTALSITDSDLYLADKDNNRIRKISLSTGIIDSVVGAYNTIDNGDNLMANQTNINTVNDIRILNNEIWFTDSGNNKIRKTDISGKGKVITIAGKGSNNETIYENMLAALSSFNNPGSISYLPSGELIIADSGNNVIRKVDLNGRITAIAGQYYKEGFNGNDSPNAKKSLLSNPKGLTTLNDGRIIFADSNNIRIRMLTPYCPEGYFMTQTSSGTVCNITNCYGIPFNDSSVCSGRGSCKSLNNCLCFNGFSGLTCSKEDNPKPENITTCYGVAFNDSNVCSGNGICQSLNNCNCSTLYYGANCEQKVIVKVDNITTCYGIVFNDSSVCSGHGLCQSLNNCNCSSGYSGFNCSTEYIPPKDDGNTPQADYCTLYPDSFVCSSATVNTTETQITKVSNISQLDSKTIQFSSTSTISIALPPIISQYLQNLDVSLKNDTVQVVSSVSEASSSNNGGTSVISSIVSLTLLKSSSNEKISVQNLEQPISLSFENISLTLPNIEELNISCVYFDEISKEWKSDGLQTQIENQVISQTLSDGNITVTLSIKCKTNHLTSFSVIDQNYKKANNQPNTVPDKAIVQDSAVLIGAIVGSIGGVCVITTIIILIVVATCLVVKKKRNTP